jgi:hypothetical protein
VVFGFSGWGRVISRGRRPGWDLPGHGPHKAGQFAGHGGHRHLGLLLAHAGQVGVAVMQAPLGLPSNVGDGFGQAFLPLFQVGTQAGGRAILPRRFDQGAAGRPVAHFGDAAYQALNNSVIANRQSLEIANALYTSGNGDFLNVLDSERSLFGAEDQLVDSQRAVTENLVTLYKALGGGWEIETKALAMNKASQNNLHGN